MAVQFRYLFMSFRPQSRVYNLTWGGQKTLSSSARSSCNAFLAKGSLFAVLALSSTRLSLALGSVHSCKSHESLYMKTTSAFCTASDMSAYSVIEKGSKYSLDYRIYLKGPSGIISPFHDIPLHGNTERSVYNMVVEIPRWTNAKMEISREDDLNPIRQDVKKGKPRFTDNVFPYHGYIWNYGALPQTWEDPQHVDPYTKMKGDNDPVDICEIGSKVHSSGKVIKVKVLGVFALIDEGETDWKILAIDITDPLASQINDLSDVEKHMPGLLQASYNWLRLYKVPAGKGENKFAFDGEPKDAAFAKERIAEMHKTWKKLIMSNESSDIKRANTVLTQSPHVISAEDAMHIVESNPEKSKSACMPAEVTKWHYVE